MNFVPDAEPRTGPYHRRIVKTHSQWGTLAGGYRLELDCGHEVRAIGSLDHLNGVAYCFQCAAKRPEQELLFGKPPGREAF